MRKIPLLRVELPGEPPVDYAEMLTAVLYTAPQGRPVPTQQMMQRHKVAECIERARPNGVVLLQTAEYAILKAAMDGMGWQRFSPAVAAFVTAIDDAETFDPNTPLPQEAS